MRETIILAVVFTIAFSADCRADSSGGPSIPDAKHCTFGDATATLQGFEVGLIYASNWLYNIKVAGLGGTANCQYRFFLPQKPTNGERFRFCGEDVFLGGVVWFFEFLAAGFSRNDAIELLGTFDSTVSFGPADGTQSERSLIRTGYKDFAHPDFGNAVYTQERFYYARETRNILEQMGLDLHGCTLCIC